MSTLLVPEAPVYTLDENLKKKKAGIVVAGWHKDITNALAESAKKTLLAAGLQADNIIVKEVPGAFELALGAQFLYEYLQADLVVAIGCVVKGETPHFHYISESVTQILGQLQMKANRPLGYGLLTVDTIEQAQERAGGPGSKHGNKGVEAAHAALYMMAMKEEIKKGKTKSSIGFGAVSTD